MYFCLCHKYYIDWRAAMSLRFKVISNSATYQLTRNVAGVDEGSTFQITLTTTGVQNGQLIPYVITGISQNDIAEPLSGYFVVQGGSANKTFTVYADVTTEGTEIFTLTLSDVTNKDVSVTINDTSAAPSTDPHFADVMLLMHMEGTNGSTVFTDVKSHTVTPATGTTISTTHSQFGNSSALLNHADAKLTVSSDAWGFTGDFTAEAWIYPVVMDYYATIFNSAGGTYPYFFTITPYGGIRLYQSSSASDLVIQTASGEIATGSWHHFAVTRSGTTVRVFVNGVQVGINTNYIRTWGGTGALNIGNDQYGSVFKGYIDEVRITKGVARYTSNFTPVGPFLDA